MSVADAQTWEAETDFSTTSNPGECWSYGTRATPTGDGISLLPDAYSGTVGAATISGWRDSQYMSLGTPTVYRNLSECAFVSGTVTVPPGGLVLHPGPTGFGPNGSREVALVRWNSPITGTVEVSGTFYPCDAGSTDVHIVHNGATLFATIRASHSSVPFSLSDVSVSQGDTIDFVVGNDGSYYMDSTGLAATISAPSLPGDCDFDGDVDLIDYADLEACLLGPGGGIAHGGDCFDLDEDGDVDLIDFAEFQPAFTGESP